ncbi:Hypothetical predicted protein [Olea europaea subsp. europaea]|uniref:Uncharacterized protein n=1 Tax=Olea europaea subsp. europaea TaxID=158383 RepID=A0A8S0QZI0_OLEEU|nr:Hypothetical predicted protein [Olea europaea subsp. europaea]
MAGNNRQKKSSDGSFSLFNIFKGKSSRGGRVVEDTRYNDSMKACIKVWRSDEDRGRYVAKPGIDDLATAYIISTTEKWKNVAVSD